MFKLATAVLAAGVSTFAIGQSFMPENDLHLRLNASATSMTERDFNNVIDNVSAFYAPVFKDFGAKLNVIRAWNDRTVNAYAYQSGSTWYVKMFGGLARQVTKDAFATVLCHEIGHHLGGFPFTSSNSWAANDGMSDYFATNVCMRKVLADETQTNKLSIKTVTSTAKKACDAAWATDDDRNVCYRISLAGQSLAELLGRGMRVNYATPDRRKVSQTDMRHPPAQCRLDTYLAGAVCATKNWDDALIPGKSFSNRLGRSAELESAGVTCHSTDGETLGARPRCWFSPGI